MCGHILCLCISAEVEVVPTSSLVQKERGTKCVGKCWVNGGGSSGLLVSMVCEV